MYMKNSNMNGVGTKLHIKYYSKHLLTKIDVLR